jgi:large subunit ribosomal protein L21
MSYAIIQTGGKQYRVAEGDILDVEKLDATLGQVTTFSDGLMLADGSSVTFGAPFIKNASVQAEVLDQWKDEKVIAFKFRRRKGYHRTVGHRRRLTKLKITAISKK